MHTNLLYLFIYSFTYLLIYVFIYLYIFLPGDLFVPTSHFLKVQFKLVKIILFTFIFKNNMRFPIQIIDMTRQCHSFFVLVYLLSD